MSSFDLIVRNASLPDGRTGLDIGVQDGKITAVAPNLPRVVKIKKQSTDQGLSSIGGFP